jgi:uncharacterized protein (TIGR02145 family)
MKKLILFLLILAPCALPAQQATGTFIDDRDGQSYQWIKIGTQIWMAENLNYDTGRGCYCYDRVEANCEKYGRLYNWKEAKMACPDGWHLPDYEDWEKLAKTIKRQKGNCHKAGNDWSMVGRYLKSLNGWKNNGGGEDTYGFKAIPAGNRTGRKLYNHLGEKAYFFSADEYDNKRAWVRLFNYHDSEFSREKLDKDFSFSVRCIKD